MKFSVGARQPGAVLQVADEIKVSFNDRNYLFDLIEKYPDKHFVLDLYNANQNIEETDWQLFAAHNEKSNSKLLICLYNYEHIKKCKEYELKYYYGIPADTMYKLRAFKTLGCACALIEAPLAFDLERAKNLGMSLRMVPNMGMTDGIPRRNGIHGAWVRPEDIHYYEPYIDTFEFMVKDAQQERGYLSVYKEGYWNDDLSLLITGLNKSIENYILNSEEFVPKRLICRQRCENGGACHICDKYFDFINSVKRMEDFRKDIFNKFNDKEN